MLSIKNLTKSYQTTKSKKKDRFLALKGISIDFPETGLVFLLGKSGSGKSTLLNAIGGLDSFDSGEIIIKGKSSKDFSQSDFDSYRNTFIGFIFQEYNILENFTVEKNLALAIELQGKKATKERVHELLKKVDMLELAKRKPNQLSGGQKQRVAIARALIKNPEIIMADEPTGALDSATGKQVMETLKELSKNKLVIIVSHDRDFAETYGDRIIELKDGKIISDTSKTEINAKKTQSGMSIVEDSYIHIKKGQKLTSKDLEVIGLMIYKNSSNSDTIISLNNKVTTEIKKTQGITNDGNQTTFKDTNPEDVKIKKYNPKDLKLIRSRLKFSDSFKMGVSALKSKVWKLVFTIILSFFAFTVFGIVDAMACWDRASSVYNTLQITGQKNVMLSRTEQNKYGTMTQRLSDNDLKTLSSKFSDMKFLPVIDANISPRFNNISNSYNSNSSSASDVKELIYNNDNLNNFSFAHIDSIEDLNYYDIPLIEGRLPQSKYEIVVSKYYLETLMYLDEGIKSYKDVEGKVYIKNKEEIIKVVGVFDDKVDLTKYLNSNAVEFRSKGYEGELQTKLDCGFSKIIIVHESLYDYAKENSSNGGAHIDLGKTSNYISKGNLCNINQIVESYNAYTDGYAKYEEALAEYNNSTDPNKKYPSSNDYYDYNNNITFYVYRDQKKPTTESVLENLELTNKEIILSYDILRNYVDPNGNLTSGDEIIQKIYDAIQDGLKVKITDSGNWDYDTGQQVYTTVDIYTVVGCVYNAYGKNIVNTDSYKLINSSAFPFSGYESVITRLSGNQSDKEFIYYIENYNEDNVKYPILNESTQIYTLLEDIIETASTYILYFAIGFAFFASLLLMNFISNSISYKKREIGVLRALGARGSDVFGIFFNESAVIAFINFVLASIATFIACYSINSAIVSGLGFHMTLLNPSIRQIIIILLVSLGSAFLASLLPVLKIARKKPIDAINNR